MSDTRELGIEEKLRLALAKKERLLQKQVRLKLKLGKIEVKIDAAVRRIADLRSAIRVDAQATRQAGLSLIPPDVREGMRPTGPYWGLISRVAKQLGVNRSSVADAAEGRMTSSRIAEAVTAEIFRIRRTMQPAITASQYAEMTLGGKYHGLMASVAKETGVNIATVRAVARSKSFNRIVLAALHKGIARIDSEPPQELLPRLTGEQKAAFKYGGRYWGLYRLAGRRAGCCGDTVAHNAKHGLYSSRGMKELYEEMARVDAEIVAKAGQSHG